MSDEQLPMRPSRVSADFVLIVAALICQGGFLTLGIGYRVSPAFRDAFIEHGRSLSWGFSIAAFVFLALSLVLRSRRR